MLTPLRARCSARALWGPPLADLYFGDVRMPVTLGQLFGFRVGSQDNLFLPGVLTVSDFAFTPTGSGASITNVAPEPGSLPLMLVAVGLGFAARRRMIRASKWKTESE